MKPKWNEVNEKEQKEIISNGEITWEQFADRYDQPEWCNYPDALHGMFGCWSLLFKRRERAEDCRNCEFRNAALGDQ